MLYKPKKSYGGWVGLLIGLAGFGFALWGIGYSLDESMRTLKLMLLLPAYLFLVIYLYILLGAFNLGYKVEPDGLVLIWGLQKKRISWDQFKEIIEVKGQANFLPFITASWWGYMFGVYSAKGLGSVRMYATYAQDGFLYLKTQKGFYGITPADPGLLAVLLEKTGQTLQTVDMDLMSPEEKGESMNEDPTFKLNHRLNVISLVAFAVYLAIFFPGSGAPKFIILLLVLALALFIFTVGNAKRMFQFSPQGADVTLLIGLLVTLIFFALSFYSITLK